MKIINHGKLNYERHLLPGDSFQLLIDGEVVHRYDIYHHATIISGWALVKVGTSVGYFVGDDNLLQDLLNAGATLE